MQRTIKTRQYDGALPETVDADLAALKADAAAQYLADYGVEPATVEARLEEIELPRVFNEETGRMEKPRAMLATATAEG